MNYARFVNKVSAARRPSAIRKITELVSRAGPGLISFGAGAPNAACFPFRSMTVALRDGSTIELDGADMGAALQYGPSQGHAGLVRWLLGLQAAVHKPPLMSSADCRQTTLAVTPGSQDALGKIFDMALAEGDSIVVDAPSYPGTLAALRALHVRPLPIAVDGGGMDTAALAELLEAQYANGGVGGRPPKVVYVQSSCSNPAGVGLSMERRRHILELARRYDLLVIEDDPYYYLNFASRSERLPSLLSLDEDGRVLRLDSFSKIISSGMRVGVVTGPRALVDRIVLHQQVSSMHCSSLSQTLLYRLLQKWGVGGFLRHTDAVSAFYKSRCDSMLAAIDRHCEGLLTYHPPAGGMFVWLRAAPATRIADTAAVIERRALDANVVLVPGRVFHVDETEDSMHMRAAFSMATEEQMDEGFKRLADLLRKEAAGS